MSGLDIEPWEPEETIGKLWHSFASRLDAPAALHEDARVTLDEVAGRVAVLFRGLGGGAAVEIRAAAPEAVAGAGAVEAVSADVSDAAKGAKITSSKPKEASGRPELTDPRERGGAEEGELGLGPIDPKDGRFSGIRLVGETVQLEYTVGETTIRERLMAEKEQIIRLIEVGPRGARLHLRTGAGDGDWLELDAAAEATTHRIAVSEDGTVNIAPGGTFDALPAPARRRRDLTAQRLQGTASAVTAAKTSMPPCPPNRTPTQ